MPTRNYPPPTKTVKWFLLVRDNSRKAPTDGLRNWRCVASIDITAPGGGCNAAAQEAFVEAGFLDSRDAFYSGPYQVMSGREYALARAAYHQSLIKMAAKR